MSCKDLETLKQSSIKSTKSRVGHPIFFNVLNNHCYSMCLNQCKFEFSKDPRQFYNLVNAKRKSYNLVNAKRKYLALPSSVRLNSIEASTDPEIEDLFAEFFQSTYSSL